MIGRLDPRVPSHERTHRVRPVVGRRGVQRGAAEGVVIVWVHAVRAEQVDDVGVAPRCGEEEGRGAPLVSARESRALGEETLELLLQAEVARREDGIGSAFLQLQLRPLLILTRRRHLPFPPRPRASENWPASRSTKSNEHQKSACTIEISPYAAVSL